jgi:hypothetical protein
VFISAKEGFKDEVKYQKITTDQERIELVDDSGVQIVVNPYRTFILILLSNNSIDASHILEDLKKHLN